MTKASKAISSARIVDYHREHFAKADQASYYTEGGKIVGQFHGRLAEEFGLIGKPATEELVQRLADGQHPWTGEQLVKHRSYDPTPPLEEPPKVPRSVTEYRTSAARWRVPPSRRPRRAQDRSCICLLPPAGVYHRMGYVWIDNAIRF